MLRKPEMRDIRRMVGAMAAPKPSFTRTGVQDDGSFYKPLQNMILNVGSHMTTDVAHVYDCRSYIILFCETPLYLQMFLIFLTPEYEHSHPKDQLCFNENFRNPFFDFFDPSRACALPGSNIAPSMVLKLRLRL